MKDLLCKPRRPPIGSPRRIALTLGGSWNTAQDPPVYWIEYRIPQNFDLGICTVVSTKVNDLPSEGVLVLHQMNLYPAREPLASPPVNNQTI